MSLTAEERAEMVRLARQSVEAAVSGKPLPVAGGVIGAMSQPLGCFVTLTNNGRLRGCIGTFQPGDSLGQTLPRIAAEAARDGRFFANPVTRSEIPQLTVEVSILSPLTPMKSLDELTVGTHGIYIMRGGRAGCFLPEVATDMGWTREQFLRECCAGKAGLPSDAWSRPGTTVYLFTSEKFES